MDNLLENFVEYDPDEDMNSKEGGSWGIKIAEAIFRACDYNFDKIKGLAFYRDYKRFEELSK